jgi:hypothetical protein
MVRRTTAASTSTSTGRPRSFALALAALPFLDRPPFLAIAVCAALRNL